jgi:hypothetical protein
MFRTQTARLVSTFLVAWILSACGDEARTKSPISPPNNSTVPLTCGNGVLDQGEACDNAIASGEGACPTSCAAPACAAAALEGSADDCSARCTVQPVACAAGDGCCPEGCDSSTDPDCVNTCGNGLVESPETCDGNCPASCDDGNACTNDSTSGSADTCSLVCSTTPISACIDGDGCCPPGCEDDSDCSAGAECGNGVVEAGELCDGDCPTSCDDGNACTTNQRFGSPDQCNVSCSTTRIQTCQSGDGCCPAGCSFDVDSDCNCTPSTCQQLGVECGAADNGCGMPVDCGGCPGGKVCAAGVCEPDTGGNGQIGDSCMSATDCQDSTGFGASCESGVCTQVCLPGLLPCPMGAVCIAADASAPGFCYVSCMTSADCRPGFRCVDDGFGARGCAP